MGQHFGILICYFPQNRNEFNFALKISKRLYGQNTFLRKCPKERERQANESRFLIWFSKNYLIHISVCLFFVLLFFPWFCYWKMMLAILNFFADVNFTVKSRFFSRESGGTMRVKFPGKRKVTTTYWRFRSALPASSMVNRVINDIVTRNITT